MLVIRRLLGSVAFTPIAVFALAPQQALAQATAPTETPTPQVPVDSPAQVDTTTANQPEQSGRTSTSDIVVTGSRIAHTKTDTVSPVAVITSKDLDLRGYGTLADALNEQPQFGIPGASPVGDAQSGFGAGQNFVNFLGLGSQRTLVLVDGLRFVSSNDPSIFGSGGTEGGSQVDINVIPTKLIDHVETVAAIGAPIYGSDAIAGTINIILKKNFKGIDLDAQVGRSTYGDAPKYRIRGLAGTNFADGRGNITVAGEYDNEKGLRFTDRSITSQDDRFALAADGSGIRVPYADFRVPSIATTGIPLVGGGIYGLDFPLSPQQANLVFGDPTANFGVGSGGTQLRFDPAGNLIPIDFGSTIGPDTGFNVFTSGGNGFSLSSVENLLTDLKRYNANVLFNYELTSKSHLFAQGWYSVAQGRNLTDQPAYNSGLFGSPGSRDGSIIVSVNNPFLTAAARTAILNSIATNPFSDQNQGVVANQDYFYLGRANYDLQSGTTTTKTTIARFVGGYDTSFNVVPAGEWKFVVTGNYGRSRSEVNAPSLNQQNFLNAINAVRDSSGNIVCAPGYTNSAIATLSSTCAPLDLFGNNISSAAKDYVTTIARSKTINTQVDFVGSLAGPLFRLPGGNLSFAAGYEHRIEKSNFDPGVFLYGVPGPSPRDTYGRSTAIDPVYGKYHTNEFFGELDGDIIGPDNNIPFVNALSFQAAGRLVDNSIAGRDFTYTVGGRYAPIRQLSFRAAITRAIRSPSITEAFNPSASSYIFADDPCDPSNIGLGPAAATRAANCASLNLPANFSSLANQRTINGLTFGNPNLKNEVADSFTAGVVLRPLRGLTTTVDYINIRIKQAISAFSPDQVLDACYDSASFPNNPFCSLVSRDSSGQLTEVQTSFFNSALFQYRGVVAGVDYRVPTPFLGAGSQASLSVNYQHLIKLSNSASAGDTPSRLDGSIGYSRDRAVISLQYQNTQGFLGQIQGNYIGPANLVPDQHTGDYSIPRVKGVMFTNLSLAQTFAKRYTLRADVDNVFNVKPPYPSLLVGAYNTYFSGILGRYYRVGIEVGF